MIKKYILIIALIGQSFTKIKPYPNTAYLMAKTYNTYRYVKNISKYAPKIMKAILYIGIPTVLTGSTLLYIACNNNTKGTSHFWPTCQEKTKLKFDNIKRSAKNFIEEHGPEIKENIHTTGTTVVKGLVCASKEIAFIIKDALTQ